MKRDLRGMTLPEVAEALKAMGPAGLPGQTALYLAPQGRRL